MAVVLIVFSGFVGSTVEANAGFLESSGVVITGGGVVVDTSEAFETPLKIPRDLDSFLASLEEPTSPKAARARNLTSSPSLCT